MTRAGVDLDLGFTVTPDNVLDAYAVIAEEATRLRVSLQFFRMSIGQGMPRCGGDPVSADASKGFTHLASELAHLCSDDVIRLLDLADKLAQTARQYGKSDEQITAVFNRAEYRYRPAPLTASAGGTGR